MKTSIIKNMLTVFCIILIISACLLTVNGWYIQSLYLSNWWCVDSGNHLDWSGSTTYSTQWNQAVSTWNNYAGSVIRQDTALTINDIVITDTSSISATVAATTTTDSSSGKSNGRIYFSRSVMDTFNNSAKRVATTHELGHTLGLADQPNDSSAVMYKNVSGTSANYSLTANDKYNYDESSARF